MTEGVFVYGSLAGPATMASLVGHPAVAGRDYAPATLPGWTLTWHVCTDNTASDRKVSYENPEDGTRPPIQVLFLTVERAPGASVRGILIAVPGDALPALDAREGNYVRTAVTVDSAREVWTYVAKPASAARARRAIGAGTARVRRDYHESVTAAYRFHPGLPSVPNPPAPITDLRRILVRPADPPPG